MKSSLKFLQSGPLMSELEILNLINNSPRISQSSISKEVNLAPSMINNYIKKLSYQGFIKKQNVTNRDLQYNLTDEGNSRRLYLMISYLSEIINLYKISKTEIEKRFQNVISQDIKRILFYGAGEAGEVAIHAIENFDIDLIGIIDDNADLLGRKFYGYTVFSFEHIERLKPDAIIITSFTYQDIIFEKLKEISSKGIKVIKM